MPSGKSKTSGSENGAVVRQAPSSQITGGLRHSSMVVQMENDGAKLVALHRQVRPVAHPELVDLGEEVVGGVAGQHVGEPRLDPDPDQREPTGRLPVPGDRELLVAELHARPLVRRLRVRARERHRHVQVVRPGLAGPGEDRHHEARVDRVHHVGDGVLAAQCGDRARVGGVDASGGVPLVDRGGPLGAGQVVVGDDDRLEEVAAGRDRGEGRPDTAGTDQQDPHAAHRSTPDRCRTSRA